jgi:acetyl esterase
MTKLIRLFIFSLLASTSGFSVYARAAEMAAQPNADMSKVLNELQNKKGKPIENLTAKEARKQPTPTDAVKALMKSQNIKADKTGFAKIDDIKIDGADGKLSARVYQPEGDTVMPLIVYFHGGGWVIADKDVYDASARAIAKQAKAIVLSVDYREAPEHKFPAAHEDAFAAYKWALTNAQKLNADPKKVAVAGESAGGNLAVNVSIRARDAGIQMPVHELIVYPIAGSDMNTVSYQENASAKPLSKPMMGWFMKNYLNSMDEAKDKRIDLVNANLKGLPPTTIITAQIDPLRSEGKELSDRMKAAGVDVDYKNYDGVTHEFFGMADVLPAAREAQSFAVGDLNQTLQSIKQ